MTHPNELTWENLTQIRVKIHRNESVTNEEMVALIDSVSHLWEKRTEVESQLQQTKEELKLRSQAHEHAERDLNRTHTQLEQVKAERDNWLRIAGENGKFYMDALKELETKDKVLEWYGEPTNYLLPEEHAHTEVSYDEGLQARTILSQYTKEEKK